MLSFFICFKKHINNNYYYLIILYFTYTFVRLLHLVEKEYHLAQCLLNTKYVSQSIICIWQVKLIKAPYLMVAKPRLSVEASAASWLEW